MRFRKAVIAKTPFAIRTPTGNAQRKGPVVDGNPPAGAEAADRQPSKPASGRGDARQGGDSPAIPTPEATVGLDQGSGHATAAKRLSSTRILFPFCVGKFIRFNRQVAILTPDF